MATEQYKVSFSAPPAKILADIKAIKAAFLDLDKVIDRTQAKCYVFASRAAANFNSVTASAKGTSQAIGGIGAQSMQALDAQVKALKRDLDAANASAGRFGMGGGGGGGRGVPRVGAGGKAGVAQKPGFVQSAMDIKAVADMGIGLGRAAANLTAGTISDQADRTREYFGTAAEKASQFQQEMRSWASLTGKNGVSGDTAKEVFDFARQAGIPVQEAGKFLDRFEGSAQLGIEKGNLPAGLKTDLMKVGSQFGNRIGIDPDVAADITAFIPQFNKIDSTSKFAGILGGAHYGIDQGKGDLGKLMSATIGASVAGIPEGRLSGIPEAAAWIGTLSGVVGKEGMVDEAQRQVTRLLNKPAGKPGAAYLASIGIPGMKGDLAKIQALKADIDRNAGGKPIDYLMSKKFDSTEEVQAVAALLPEVPTLTSRVAKANSFLSQGADVLAKNTANQALPLVEGKRAQAAIEANEIEQGYIQQTAENALKMAKARLTTPLPGGGNALTERGIGEIYRDKMASFRTWMRGGGTMSAEEILIQQQAMQSQIAAGLAVGVDLTKPPEGYGLGNDDKPNFAAALEANMALPPQEFSRQFAANQAQIDAKRAAASRALRNAAGALDAMGRQDAGGGAGAAGGPAVDPKRR